MKWLKENWCCPPTKSSSTHSRTYCVNWGIITYIYITMNLLSSFLGALCSLFPCKIQMQLRENHVVHQKIHSNTHNNTMTFEVLYQCIRINLLWSPLRLFSNSLPTIITFFFLLLFEHYQTKLKRSPANYITVNNIME